MKMSRDDKMSLPERHDTTQGLDGDPFISYYDRDYLLSFVWSGDPRQRVDVSQGGYGEPVRWTFDVPDMTSGELADNAVTTKEAMQLFSLACQNWIDQQQNIPGTWLYKVLYDNVVDP